MPLSEDFKSKELAFIKERNRVFRSKMETYSAFYSYVEHWAPQSRDHLP
jgi:hypothetical protein